MYVNEYVLDVLVYVPVCGREYGLVHEPVLVVRIGIDHWGHMRR